MSEPPPTTKPKTRQSRHERSRHERGRHKRGRRKRQRPGAEPDAQANRLQQLLAFAATTAIAGLALVATGPSWLGAAATLAGLTALIYGLHRYGRLGPEEG